MVMKLVEFIAVNVEVIRGAGFALIAGGSLLLVVGLVRRR